MLTLSSGQLKLYSSVKETSVDWLWHPYIPFGKVTLLQGDPGGGKSSLMMNIIAAVSNGTAAADGIRLKKPMHVIYQCSEDGASDTIKPRLIKAGADFRVCAYCRVSTDNDEPLSSYELQQAHYKQPVHDHPNWDLRHIYADAPVIIGLKNQRLKKC